MTMQPFCCSCATSSSQSAKVRLTLLSGDVEYHYLSSPFLCPRVLKSESNTKSSTAAAAAPGPTFSDLRLLVHATRRYAATGNSDLLRGPEYVAAFKHKRIRFAVRKKIGKGNTTALVTNCAEDSSMDGSLRSES